MDTENGLAVLEKKEILLLGTAQMTLEDIMLSKISQAQKDKYNIVSIICRT